MTSPSEQDPSKSNDASARRSKRVNLAIPIVLSGTDNSGNKFQETTRTVVVNKHGAKVKTTKELEVGMLVTIENRSLNLATKAVVVGIGKRQYPGEPIEVGVQLTQAGNVWGIIFPPDDWEAGPLPGVEGGEADLASTPPEPAAGDTQSPAAVPSAVQPAPSSPGPTSGPDVLSLLPAEAAPPRGVVAAGPPREKIDAITAAVAAKLTKQLDEVADKHLKSYAEKVIRFTNQFALRVQANFQDAANRTEDQMVVLIQQKLGGLADRVQVSRNALESLLARFEALQKNSKTLIEDTEQGIREAGQLGLESAVQDLNGRLRKGFEGTSAAMEAECQERVRVVGSKSVNATLAKVDEQLAALAQERLVRSAAELKWQQERMIDGVKEQLNQIALSGTTSLTAKLEAMGEEIVPAMREGMEKSLQESAGKVAAQTTQSLQGQTQVLIQDALVSLQQAVQSLQDRMQEEGRKVRQSTEQEVNKVAVAFNANVVERTEMAIGSVHSAAEQVTSKLKAAQLESVRGLRASAEDFHRQLATRSGMTLEGFQTGMQNLTREMQESAAQVFSQKLQFTTDELAEAAAEKLRLRIQEEAVAATEVFSADSKKRLATMADEFLASSSQELQARLRSQTEEQFDSAIQSASDKFGEHLKRLTREAGITLAAESQMELQKVASTLTGASSDTLRADVGLLTSKLRDDLKAFQATFADQTRRQLLTMAQSTVGTLNQEALAGLEQFRARLHTVAQESHHENLRTLESTFQEVLEKHRAGISASVQQQAEQSREVVGLQIKTIGEQIVANATEALDRQAGKSTRTIAGLGEQTRASLENQVQKIEMEAKKSLWEYQRQMEQSTSASLDKFRKDTGTLLDEVAFRLQQSVRSFQSATADEVLGELQKASNNLLEVSAAQMRKQTEQSLDLITERLKQKEEEVVSEVVNVFRSRIAEIFTILQEGPKNTSTLPDSERVKKEG